MQRETIRFSFEAGTIVVEGIHDKDLPEFPWVQFDSRTRQYRAEAKNYRPLVEKLVANSWPYVDEAKKYEKWDGELIQNRNPFPHQIEAVQQWWQRGARGLVVLPTGTGKTYVAILAIARTKRPALIVTPTIDLLHQWQGQLSSAFAMKHPVGMLGGGEYNLQPLTVTTYDSAYIHLDRIGNRFGLLIFDECHHLPGPSYGMIARGSIAPFRLGLTATPERTDCQEDQYPDLLGPLVYRREINELSGDFLAEYRTQKVYVDLTPHEQQQYAEARRIYRSFLEESGISISGPNGWQRFIFEASRSEIGWKAYKAYRLSKQLERAATGKMQTLEKLMCEHYRDRIIIFTADNATVYQIARTYLVPPITHQTRAKERKEILAKFHSGEYQVVVTSQVLNEGVDVPAANVGIVLSGTGTIRENVQRLGRLLRKQQGKQAILYELVARDTAEEFTSERRRQHRAFQ